MAVPILQVDQVHTAYGLSRVLFGVSLEVAAGECVCLLGRNGVGKTTTMRSIMGLTPPRQGRVTWKGRDITGWSPWHVAAAGIGFVPEDRRIFPQHTVLENLQVAAHGSRGPWTIERVMELFPRLRERAANRSNRLSGGEQQMLAIARALMGNPELLLMDEPTEGLAPLLVREVGRVIGELKRAGLSILLVEQNLPMAASVADRVHVLNRGQIVYSGPPAQLLADEAVKSRYLGVASST